MEAVHARTILLKDGETIQGELVLLNRAEYLVQTADLCLRLSADEIESVDGMTDLYRMGAKAREPSCETSYFHQVHADGGGTDWTRSIEVHRGDEPRTHQTWFFGRQKKPMSDEELMRRLRWAGFSPMHVIFPC